jgi:hypothetical protein
VDVLKHADKVVICGEALSHCVNYTVRDLVDAWPQDRLGDLVILIDCASPVPGFEAAGEVHFVLTFHEWVHGNGDSCHRMMRTEIPRGHESQGPHAHDLEGVCVVIPIVWWYYQDHTQVGPTTLHWLLAAFDMIENTL